MLRPTQVRAIIRLLLISGLLAYKPTVSNLVLEIVIANDLSSFPDYSSASREGKTGFQQCLKWAPTTTRGTSSL
jgi:hypothetical protein